MKPIKELPPLDDSSRNGGSRGFSRNSNGSTRGGSYSGNRNSERSSKNNPIILFPLFYLFCF